MGNACATSSGASGVNILRSSSSGSDADRPQSNKNGSPSSSSSNSSSDSDRSPRGKRRHRHHEQRLSRDSSFSSDGWSGSSPCHSTGGRRRPCVQALPPQKDGTKRFKVTLSKSDMDEMLCRDSAAGDFLDNILTTYVRHRHQQQQQQHLAGSIAD